MRSYHMEEEATSESRSSEVSVNLRKGTRLVSKVVVGFGLELPKHTCYYEVALG